MRNFLLTFVVALGQSVVAANKKPLIADLIIEKAIHGALSNQLTEVPKGLGKLSQLTYLDLKDNPDLTEA